MPKYWKWFFLEKRDLAAAAEKLVKQAKFAVFELGHGVFPFVDPIQPKY